MRPIASQPVISDLVLNKTAREFPVNLIAYGTFPDSRDRNCSDTWAGPDMGVTGTPRSLRTGVTS